MLIWSSVIFPFLLGLLGFIEPCSLGANLIFLQYLLSYNLKVQLFHVLLFTLTRASFLSLLGVLAALVGQHVIAIQGHYVSFLGLLYLIFGLIILLRGQTWRFTLPFPRLPERSLPILLGGAFGLAVPACASPLILVLTGGAALSGQLWFGFSSLFIFGLGLSVPLVIAVWSDAAREAMTRIAQRYPKRLEYLVGGVLVVAGLYTLFTQNGSLMAIVQK